jgi:acetylglutamate kinase
MKGPSVPDSVCYNPPMEKVIEKASVLLEALPYIRSFAGKTVVIKYGGAAMVSQDLKEGFARDVVLLKYIGINPVIVHGGGPQISETLKRMGITARFVDGHRVTDAATLDVVEMVLTGKVNKEIVQLVTMFGGRAVGLSGKDGGTILARRKLLRKEAADGVPTELVDLGLVGEVTVVDPGAIRTLEAGGFIPILAPVGTDGEGTTLNINADSVASAVAASLKAEKLILLTDTAGVLDARGKLVTTLDRKSARGLIKRGVISGGMIPKVECCLDAVAGGVAKTHIIDGRLPHAVLLEIFTQSGVGTEIHA